MYLSRYLAYLTPLAIVAAGRGLSLVPGDSRVLSGALAVGAIASLPALQAYYSNSSRDTDVRPVLAYIKAAGDGTARDETGPILVAPAYLTYPLLYYSRDRGLVYAGVEPSANLWRAVDVLKAAEPAQPIWIVLDYRWRNFRRDSADRRVQDVEVPSARRPKIRLLRVLER